MNVTFQLLVGSSIRRCPISRVATFFLNGTLVPGFYENWDSVEDLEAHLQAPHLVEFAGQLDELVDDSGPLVIERVRRIA